MRWSEAIARPTDRQLRQFAWCGAAALVLFCVGQLFGGTRPVWAAGYMGGALLLVLVGTWRPKWLAPVFIAWMIAAFPIAWCVSMAVLGLIYFGLFAPLALVFRWQGRDPLQLRSPREQKTFWSDKPAAKDIGQYLKQF